ncbi:S-layer homology domain-containing protein [Paenibacillus motobuensis]|uniref:NHL domain-containing protein n=1 Tax=Paenibacillus TaxID=44249 RepID=UPI002040DE8E|nr:MULTISPECIES: S-layer homology domain-containing protein [Paenibacillus]MCM3038592.1 S-layer homology domain-containing protein [Paenibacillus lutimineralis]MCM3645696.1 S-layer homology domain-containing protein [Paenibacillus motobuensis]
MELLNHRNLPWEGKKIRKQIKKLTASVLALLLITSMVPELNGGKVHAASGYTINTEAGIGINDYSGDGGPAASAELNYPGGVAVDSSGNLYIADSSNHRVRKVDASGKISTIAGTGTGGYSGDGGPATSAQLNHPYRLTLDSAGNLYISDYSNDCIRKVDVSGRISTVAGGKGSGYSGDGGSATSAKLSYPEGVAVDSSGNLYIADKGNHRIRKVDTSGTISTVAGTGDRGYSGDGGDATSAQLNSPFGVAVDHNGNLYISDTFNHRIRKVDAAGKISTIAGTDGPGYWGDGVPAISALFNQPIGIAVDSSGNVYISDRSNDRIRKVDTSGKISTIAGTGQRGYSGDGGPATSANLDGPYGIAVDSRGNVYIADVFSSRIRKLSLSAQSVAAFAGSSIPGVGVDDPITLTVKNANGYTDTTFSGAHEVTISGYLPAPDGSFGSLNGTDLSASSHTTNATFTNGVATIKLRLNKAGEQTINLSVADVVSPHANSLIITPVAGSAASMALTTDIKAPASNGGLFAQQPVVTLLDAYGNKSVGDSITVVTVKKKDSGAWNLTGSTMATASSGIVTFTNLGATNGAVVTEAQLGFEADGLPPIESTTVTLPWEALEVTTQRIGDLPIGTKIRDSREWGYFTAGPIESGLTDAVIYKTAPINWILAAKDRYKPDTSLFISEDIIAETHEVNGQENLNSWTLSPVRQWLRGSFYAAFSSSFHNAISLTSYPRLSDGDWLEDETFFVLAAPELIPVKGQPQFVIPYFNDANNRKASGNESEYHWTRSQYSFQSYYLVNNANGGVLVESGNLKVGIRPAVNLKSDTLVEGPFIDSANGSAYYQLVQEPYQAVAELESSEVKAGSTVNVLFKVHYADGSLNTSFNELAEVTLEGYAAAPDRTFGFFAGEELDGTPKTIQAQFTNGVATVPLVLHAAVQQTLQFQIKGLLEPNLEAIVVQPESGDGKKLKIQRDISGFDAQTGLFDPQPVLWIVDDFGNVSENSSTSVEVSKRDSGNWNLTGTTVKQAQNGKVVFEDLGAKYDREITGARLNFAAPVLGSGGDVTSEAVTLPSPVFVAPINGSFDKNSANQEDITTTVTLNGNTLLSIKNGSDELLASEDYTLVGNVLTIKKEYLAHQAVGSVTLTLTFSAGTPQPLVIPIVDTELPTWPEGSTLTVSDITQTSVKLSWPMAVDNDKVISYQIAVIGTGGKAVSASEYETSINDLTADTEYTFQVRAYGLGGKESEPLTATAKTLPQSSNPDTEAPQWPESSELIVSDIMQTSVKLSWPTATDNDGVIGYRIYVDNKEHTTVTSTVYATTVNSLAANTTYTFKVTAFNEAGNESMPLAKQATTARSSSGGVGSGGSTSGGSGSEGGIILSSNAELGELQVWNKDKLLDLSPSFAVGTTNYTARTEAELVEIAVRPAHSAAKVKLKDKVIVDRTQVHLEEGDNKLVLIVIAENRSEKEYTLNIRREIPKPSEPVIHFTDISGHWAESNIKRAAANGIISGYPDGTFQPNLAVTRAEFTVMLAGALKLEGGSSSLPFVDHDQIGEWATRAVMQVVQEGIVNGYEDGSFRPNAYITRSEMAVMIARALKLQSNVQASTGFADDEAIQQWAKGAIEAIHALGIVDGRGQNRFEPNEKATRVEATVMLLRMIGQQEEK